MGGIISIYVMHSGIKMGVSRKTIIRMFVNIALEFVIGCIPILGDLVDGTLKSNRSNVKLIEKSIMSEEKNTIFGYLIIGILIKVLTGIIILTLVLLA